MDSAALLNFLSWGMILTSALTFVACMYIQAPYGRYTKASGWGVQIPAKFSWFLMECPNLVISAIVYIHYSASACSSNWKNNVMILLFVFHYINRAVVYPLRMTSAANAMPIGVVLLAFTYCCWNGTVQALSLGVVNCDNQVSNLQFYAGVLVWACGFAINYHADSTLLGLKGGTKRSSRSAGSDPNQTQGTHYKIPYGGMFKYVSCANYFGEVVEWVGFAIACGTIAGWAFALYTFSNVGPRAYHHHQWYITKFDDYKKLNRKAIIPFVW